VVSGPNGETHHLVPKAMDVFVCLAERANQLVTRNQLLDLAWRGNTAFDEQLTRVVGDLRRALHDDPSDPTYIETVPKRGYRLIGQIRLPDGTKLGKDLTRFESITGLAQRKAAFIIAGILLLALLYVAFDQLAVEPAREDAPEFSVAVLPFVNMSDDPGNEYFSDGLSEEILNLLAKIPGLKVIGRTSSFAFKGKNEDLRDIGQTLGVKTVLEGSVRKSGDRVRITAQLVDISDGTHIWSESYDRTMTDIFAVQDDVAAAIIDALQIYVGANPTRGRPTENTEAYALFLKAKASFNAFELRDAEAFLLQATELDPKFAEAYELLAATYWRSGDWIKAAEGQKLMFEAAAKALAIDPDLALAQAYYRTGNLETNSALGGIEAFQRVVLAQPSNPEPLNALAWDLLLLGYLQEALGFAERSVDLDPLSLVANYLLAETLYAVGRTSDALAATNVADQLDPNGAQWMLGEMNLVAKQDDIAIANFEAALEQDGSASSWVRELVTAARDPATGQAHLDRRIPQIVASMPEENAYRWQLWLTKWYLFFGFPDRYFELILATDLSNSTWTESEELIHVGTMYRRLGFTAHPMYLEVVKSLDFIGLWEQRGPPDFCEKVDGQWVCE
jgi:TolB-like protein/DNA-binding winged helix-turn-helix (wHTH) protein/Flp pilus assembly protein TadD